MLPKLLSRTEFREAVFKRDGYKCVLCGKTADETPEGKHDAHHLIERRLFTAPEELSGYFLDNGVTVCEYDHMRCEKTLVSVEEARAAAKITKTVLPSHFYEDVPVDKWGNTILPNGTRLRGELFFDESVQKVLADSMHLFTKYVKYSRSYHLPWSPGVSNDDRVQHDLSCFKDKEVIITLKLDGECTTIYDDYIHARSLEYAPRVDRARMKALHASIAHEIPEGWRICGENLWAKHSIQYDDLPAIFFVFSIWNEKNECLTWDETEAYANMLGLQTVPVLYRGIWDEALVKKFVAEPHFAAEAEGYVVRTTDSFTYSEFRRKLLKWVRADHVRTQAHWTRKIQSNGFKNDV